MKMPALILIHGYPFDHTLWNDVIAELGREVATFAPDLPGFGNDPVETSEPSIDRFGDDVLESFRMHHAGSAVVAGMSMGGYVALSMAERHAHDIAGLGLISTQAIADTDEGRKARREMIEKVRRQGPAVAAEAVMAKMFGRDGEQRPDLLEIPRRAAENAGTDGICWALEAMARRPDRTALLARLHVPVTVVHGAEDRIVPIARAHEMAKIIPGANFVEVIGAGHATPLENPKAVAAALRDLLNLAASAHAHLSAAAEAEQSNRPGITWGPTEKGL